MKPSDPPPDRHRGPRAPSGVFSAPAIGDCTLVHGSVRASSVTPLRVECSGWGLLSILAETEGAVARATHWLRPGRHSVEWIVPAGCRVVVRFINALGGSTRTIDIPAPAHRVSADSIRVLSPKPWGTVRAIRVELAHVATTRLRLRAFKDPLAPPKGSDIRPPGRLLPNTVRPVPPFDVRHMSPRIDHGSIQVRIPSKLVQPDDPAGDTH